MQTWNKSFEKFMAAKSHLLNSKELRGAALLKIHQIISTMMKDVKPDESDPRHISQALNDRNNFLGFNSEFRIVVNLARSLILAAEQDKKAGKPPLTFSTDLGLVGPLWYVCIRCTEPTIKMQSLELLLQIPRREGMWDSESAVKMIKAYWEVERRHNEWELRAQYPLSEVVNLVFGDGMEAEWKWKLPPDVAKNEDGSDATFLNDWHNLLDDQSWFMEDFSMANHTPFDSGSQFGFPAEGVDSKSSIGMGIDGAFESESSASPSMAAEIAQWTSAFPGTSGS